VGGLFCYCFLPVLSYFSFCFAPAEKSGTGAKKSSKRKRRFFIHIYLFFLLAFMSRCAGCQRLRRQKNSYTLISKALFNFMALALFVQILIFKGTHEKSFAYRLLLFQVANVMLH
jgi:hypothetical protein